MESDVAIRAENLGKMYRLYKSQRDRLKQVLIPPAKKLFGQIPGCYYKEFWALRNVSFDVKKGETVGVIGRNGSGKSTLLQIVCGTLNLTEGSVTSTGRTAALLELGAGFNPQFTGRENVHVNAALLGLKRREIAQRIDAIAEFAEIGDFIDQPVRTYSSGMYVRLAFSVIAHVDAEVLVIDEALSVGDALFTQKCMRFLRDFQKKGTVFFVSHDTAAVASLCDRTIFLKNGQVVEIGNTDDVLKSYLSSLYEEGQEVNGVNNVETPAEPVLDGADWRDMRADFINSTALRNDVEIFSMPPYSSNERDFGTGDVVVSRVRMVDVNGRPYSWVVGGEDVTLEIKCNAKRDIDHLVVGFAFKDRLGQVIFSDDTFISNCQHPPKLQAGEEATVKFDFRLPLIRTGDYAIDALVSEVGHDRHIHHHWSHDSLLLTAHSSSVASGLMKVAMKSITLEVRPKLDAD